MRFSNWDLTLSAYIESSKSTVFEWGVNDCALWASRFVALITGSEHAVAWQGLYDTEETAAALMLARGFSGVEAIADSILDIVPVKLAQRGDLILFAGALGICDGRKSYILTLEQGMVSVLTTRCLKAWKV